MPTAGIPPHDLSIIQGIPLFSGLSLPELEEIVHRAQTRRFPKGEFLFHQGDPARFLYILLRGRVRLTQTTPEGQEVLLRFVRDGEMFGGIAALGDATYPVSAQAVDECTTLCWDGETMSRLMESFPRLAVNALHLLADRVQELQDRLREMATERVEQRIARALLRLLRQSGRKVEEGVLIDLPLSRQDLAEMAGTTIYTASRILARWEQRGLIESRRARILIRFPHGLVAIAEDLSSGGGERLR
ncbi:MAG: Crp/Fnr family transcriptional regulator [Armatimonadota bacterium]|nr:Crp/Fnr family transcriptional regulator [Armatimonadota bacterium]MDR5702878.1 Crp/Fnr family transcriptional regulator [Armatimonadota bacterium]